MGIVSNINIIQGTDRQFTLIARYKDSLEPKDLSAFVGGSGTVLQLKMPGENTDLSITLDANANGTKIEVIDVSSGLAGKVLVNMSDIDTLLLKPKEGQNMELYIREGAGPDYNISKVQYVGVLNVKPCLFE